MVERFICYFWRVIFVFVAVVFLNRNNEFVLFYLTRCLDWLAVHFLAIQISDIAVQETHFFLLNFYWVEHEINFFFYLIVTDIYEKKTRFLSHIIYIYKVLCQTRNHSRHLSLIEPSNKQIKAIPSAIIIFRIQNQIKHIKQILSCTRLFSSYRFILMRLHFMKHFSSGFDSQ